MYISSTAWLGGKSTVQIDEGDAGAGFAKRASHAEAEPSGAAGNGSDAPVEAEGGQHALWARMGGCEGAAG
jgi:hypothetical protein